VHHQRECGPVPVMRCALVNSQPRLLLFAKVDSDTIRLLGRWRSDEMLCYLHVQAFPLVAPLAFQMLHHGHFTLMPNHTHGARGELQDQRNADLRHQEGQLTITSQVAPT
jgi:hypothetical protein